MTYVLGRPFVADRFIVTIVSRQVVHSWMIGRQGGAVQASKQPAFVIVQDTQGRTALDMTGAQIPIEDVSVLCPAVTALP